jgi:hypothetical protein
VSDEQEKQVEAIQELIAGIYIQNLRVYDVLMALLSKQDQELANKLEQLHTEGKILGPDPALKIED